MIAIPSLDMEILTSLDTQLLQQPDHIVQAIELSHPGIDSLEFALRDWMLKGLNYEVSALFVNSVLKAVRTGGAGDVGLPEVPPRPDFPMEMWLVTHNHPRGLPLSQNDLFLAVKNQVQEIHAVTREFTFQMQFMTDLAVADNRMRLITAVTTHYPMIVQSDELKFAAGLAGLTRFATATESIFRVLDPAGQDVTGVLMMQHAEQIAQLQSNTARDRLAANMSRFLEDSTVP